MLRTLLVICAILLAAASADADDIAPPPSSCPPGARGESSHLGEWCQPHTCRADAECGAGSVCREGRLCVRVEHGQMGNHQGNMPYTREIVEGSGSCDACAAPASCTPGKYCYPASAAPPAPRRAEPPPAPMDRAAARGVDQDDDGCRVGAGAPLGGIAAGVLVSLAALARTRRHRRSQP